MSIDDFNNTSHYLPILNASVLADIIVLLIVYYTPFFNSNFLMKYYEEYRLGAIIADVLILVIGMIITRYHYKRFFNEFSILNFLVLALVIQIIHDILFFLFFSSVPVGKNKFLDIFKKYAREVSWGAILGDSFMIILTVLFSVYFSKQSYNYNIILLTVLVYLIPYVLYTR